MFCRLLSLAIVAALLLVPGFAAAKPWRHAVLAPRSDAGFALMAGTRGFADKEGLELEIVTFQNQALEFRALGEGEVDSVEGAATMAGGSEDVRIIGCPWPNVTEAVFARASILTARDLEGQIVGVVGVPGSVPLLLAWAYLDANDVPASLVRLIGMGSGEERFKALAAGTVAATVVSTEYRPQAEKAGLKLLARGSDLLPRYVRRCILAQDRTLYRRREDAVRFLAAEIVALRYALRHRDEEVVLTQSAGGFAPDDPRPAALFDEAAGPGGIDPRLPIPLDKLAWMEELLVKEGGRMAVDPKRIVDDEIRDEALRRVGRE